MGNHVVFNNCEGAFSLSPEAVRWLADRGVKRAWDLIEEIGFTTLHIITVDESMIGLTRHSPILALCVQELGEKASGEMSSLEVVEIKSHKYLIRNINGIETVLTPETMNWVII